jgi:CelD/BcsL family acetyltransferase involved in cellulose biosynthesis
MTVHLSLLDRFRDADRIKSVWTTLCAASAVSYFHSWGWIEHWLGSLPQHVTVRLAVVTENDVPVLAFFLGEATVVRNKIFRSRGVFLNATGIEEYDELCIEYNGMLCAGPPQLSLQELLELLPSSWDEFFMHGLDSSAFPGNTLAQPPKSSPRSSPRSSFWPYRVVVEENAPSPYVDLELVRQTAGGYLTLLSSNTRSQVRRAYRGYEATGPIVLEAASDIDRALQIYAEMIELHQQAWRARGKSGAFASEYFRNFHRDLIRKRFAHGELQLLRVSCGRQTIGCLYNFVFKGKVYFYQSGVRYESDARIKPGLVSHAEAIGCNAKAGHAVYDFLGGEARYKASLATHQGRLTSAKIQKPRAKFRVENRLRALKSWLRPPRHATNQQAAE